MPTRLRNLRINKVALVDAGAGKGVRIALWKRRAPTRKAAMTFDELMASLPEEQRAIIAAHIEATCKATPPPPPEAKTDEEKSIEAMKRLDPTLRARFEKLEAETRSAREEAAALRAIEKRRQYVAKANELKHLVGASIDDLADIVQAVDEYLPADKAKKAHEILAASNTAISKSAAFQELGSRAADGGAGSAIGKVKGIAKALRQADPKLSEAAAMTMAIQQNPELYREYVAEQQAH